MQFVDPAAGRNAAGAAAVLALAVLLAAAVMLAKGLTVTPRWPVSLTIFPLEHVPLVPMPPICFPPRPRSPQPPAPPKALAANFPAKPRTSPSTWVTMADYPAADLRAGHEGIARFTLGINAQGRATECQITRSSGYAALDETTCRAIMRRARFNPATDATGNPVPGHYSSAVRWMIPD